MDFKKSDFNDLAVLVTQKGNKFYGRIGKVKLLDDMQIVAEFSDGKEADFSRNGSSSAEIFYRRYNELGMELDAPGEINSNEGIGPRSLFRRCRESYRLTISEIIDEYRQVFGREPERLG